jgi:hypothetical protein
MPYQVKKGSFVVVTSSAVQALKVFDTLADGPEPVAIRDMDGREVDPDLIRSIIRDEDS